jgi:alpha,alpha-trehalase
MLLLILIQTSASSRELDLSTELQLIYFNFDKDHDKKITLDDKLPNDAQFKMGKSSFKGTYQLSNLAQELSLAVLEKRNIRTDLVFENPVDRISHLIKEKYWDGLTRRIDGQSLENVIKDSKVEANHYYLYLPNNDESSFQYYKKLNKKNVTVIKLPTEIKSGFITSLGKKQGLLSLKLVNGKGVPYVVPGGRFNEMYGWDSYFHTLGTIIDGRIDLARGMVDNFVYEINHYGKILNANRTYYLTRSQPPFLTSMIEAVYKELPKTKESHDWLKTALVAAIKEYQTIWMGPDRLTVTGLSRYAGFDQGIPPEVEPGHFDHILGPFAKKYHLTISELHKRFNQGKIQEPDLVEFFHQDRAVRESGHDTTYRWRVDKEDKASDFVTVDLNALLYKYEMDLGHFIQNEFQGKLNGHESVMFLSAAKKRKKLMRKYLWNKEKGLFFDYNWKLNAQSSYISATTFYPLWAGNILSGSEAEQFKKNALPFLEEQGGLAATSKVSLEKVANHDEQRQWEYPNGWAPHQIIAWRGLINYGYLAEAERLAYKWLYMITKNAMDYHGTVPEKFDVVSRSHKVFAEYGNVGTTFSYITIEGFGWMNASYQLGLSIISEPQKVKLKALIPPEKIYQIPNPLR